MKRVVLFVLTNLAILALLSLTLRLTGLDLLLLQSTGIHFTGILIFAAIFGMGGAFLSLAISKWMAKTSMGVEIIDQPANSTEHWLLQTVGRQAQRAGIGMPEVGIFESPDPNAFATGMNKNNALVAVSTGLLEQMNEDEVEAVLGHEISHIANGDMVTMTLIQGVLNTFVIALSRVIGMLVDRVILKNERGYGIGYWVTSIIAEIILGILATMIVMWFSRYREFRADEGGARLAGRQKMIAALQRLQQAYEPEALPGQLAAFGINGGLGEGFKALFRSHPPLEERIAALRQLR